MGFFDKLKGAVGVGQPDIKIKLESSQIKAGSTIKGTVTLTGKSRAVPVEKIIVEFVETVTRREWSQSSEQYVDRKTDQVLGKKEFLKNNQELKENQSITETFELAVSGSTFSGHPYSHKIKASADLPGLDPKTDVEVYIV